MSTVPARRFDTLVFLWTSVSLTLGVCAALNSRFWWQDIIASLTVFWLPLIILGFFVTLYRFAIGRTPLIMGIAALFVMGTLLGKETKELLRFYRAPPDTAHDASVPFMLAFVQQGAVLGSIPKAKQSDVVLVGCGDGDRCTGEELKDSHPHAALSSAQGRRLLLRSKHSFTAAPQSDFGLASLAAVLVSIKVGDADPVRIGGLYLEPSISRDSFERSKTTARRVATTLKNGGGPAIVAGAFFATPFSRTPTLFDYHVGLRSALWGRGLVPTWRPWRLPIGLPASNLYFSRSISLDDFRPLEWQGEQRPFIASFRLPS